MRFATSAVGDSLYERLFGAPIEGVHPLVPLILLATIILLVAAVVSLVLRLRSGARRIGELAESADRLGRGNFVTPIPEIGSTHAGRLALALERMRQRLHALTSDLAKREGEAQAMIAGVAEGVFTVDRGRRIRYVNPQTVRLLARDASEIVGRFCGDVLDPQRPGGGRPCDDDCPIVHARFRGGARATEHLKLPDGTVRTVVISSAPSASQNDLQVQVMRDESEIEATRRLRDAVLANISHEFKTPLAAQLASIELLRDRLAELTPEQAAELVNAMQRGSLRLTQLIDNLLESVRLEAGEGSLRRRPAALDEIVEEALETMRPLLDQKHQAVEVDLPYPLPGISGDAPRLVQVLVNLLANASKFAPDNSTIRIGGECDRREVSVWVEDEGPGLPDQGALPFTRFWRGGEEPEQGGAGLGLFIVKSIVSRHGGRVTAQSSARGTRMTVILPVSEEAES